MHLEELGIPDYLSNFDDWCSGKFSFFNSLPLCIFPYCFLGIPAFSEECSQSMSIFLVFSEFQSISVTMMFLFTTFSLFSVWIPNCFFSWNMVPPCLMYLYCSETRHFMWFCLEIQKNQWNNFSYLCVGVHNLSAIAHSKQTSEIGYIQ